jgi:hypothetical protein
VKKYNVEIRELLQRKAKEKERQLELLKFFRAIGFDRISQSKTDQVI